MFNTSRGFETDGRSSPGSRERSPRGRLEDLEARLRKLNNSDADGSSIGMLSESLLSLSGLHREEETWPSPSISPPQQSFGWDWSLLQSELLNHGLPPIFDDISTHSKHQFNASPSMPSLYSALQSTVSEISRMKRCADNLSQAAQAAADRESKALLNLSQEIRSNTEKTKNLEVALRDAEKAASKAAQKSVDAERQCAMFKQEAKDLQAAVDRLHRHIQKQESSAEVLKRQLKECAERESRRDEASKAAFSRMHQAFVVNASPGAKMQGKITAEGLKPWHIVRVYERQLGRVEEEAAVAKAEASLLLQKVFSESGISNKGKARKLAERSVQREIKTSAQAIAEAETKATRATEECAILRQELETRPTAEQYSQLQRHVNLLTRRIPQKQKAVPGTALFAIEIGNNTAHKLPKSDICEIVQEICVATECMDALELPSKVRRLSATARTVQRLQACMHDICRAVFECGEKFVPWSLRGGGPDEVVAILDAWVDRLKKTSSATKGTLTPDVVRQAGSPPAHATTNAPYFSSRTSQGKTHGVESGADRMDAEVSKLPSAQVHAAKATAEQRSSTSEKLLRSFVSEFLRLFSAEKTCRQMEHAIGLMHTIHNELISCRAFLVGLRETLGLSPNASLDACAKCLATLLATFREANAERTPSERRANAEDNKTYPVRKAKTSQRAVRGPLCSSTISARKGFPEVQIFAPSISMPSLP